MDTTWELINKRMTAMDAFYKQVDKTRKRLNLGKFELTDFDGKTKLIDVINVTENRSATYVMRIIAGLMSSKWQTVIEGEITSKEAHKIEQFIEGNLEQADEYMLQEYGLAGLDAWLCNHVCHTSLIGVHWMSYIEEEEYKVHCLPLDMRWTPFVLNKWAAPITFRSKEDLLQELEGYEKVAKGTVEGSEGFGYTKPTGLKDTDNEVRDYWRAATPDEEGINELWIENKLVFRQPNIYGKLPFVFVWTPSGFMFRDKGYLERESPGLLFLNENLYDQISRQLSIDATLGFEPVLPSYEREVENPTADVSMPVPKRSESQDVAKGERHQLLPRPDVNRAQLASRDEVSRMVDEAAPMAPRAYTQPPSAIEVATEVELLDELQNPRIIALQMFKEQLARLMIDQFIVIGGKGSKGSVQTGKRGKRQSFAVADLKDPDKYFVSYQRLKQNKRLAIVNLAQFIAAYDKLPLEYNLTNILMAEDPNEIMSQLELQQAKQADPALALFDMAVKYAEEAEDMEDEVAADLKKFQSMMLVDRGVAMVKQRMQPAALPQEAQTPVPKEVKGNAGGLISLLGPGQGNIPQAKVKGVTQ
jgi:hypothetical protein